MKRQRLSSTGKKAPFSFILDEISALSPILKPMFGCFGVYIGEKIVLFLRDLEKEPEQNGVWVATIPEAYESLARELSLARPAEKHKIGKSPWLRLPSAAADFEEQTLKVCELILNGDPRIGRVPKPKKVRLSTKRKTAKTKK